MTRCVTTHTTDVSGLRYPAVTHLSVYRDHAVLRQGLEQREHSASFSGSRLRSLDGWEELEMTIARTISPLLGLWLAMQVAASPVDRPDPARDHGSDSVAAEAEAAIRRAYPCRSTAKARVADIEFAPVGRGRRLEHLMVLVTLEENGRQPFTSAFDFVPMLADIDLRRDVYVWTRCSRISWGVIEPKKGE